MLPSGNKFFPFRVTPLKEGFTQVIDTDSYLLVARTNDV